MVIVFFQIRGSLPILTDRKANRNQPVKHLSCQLFFLTLLVTHFSAAPSRAQTYQPPVFTDADRLKKIESVIPVLDEIYEVHGEKNHFPGFVYGLIVDGKMVHTQSMGYTDLDKKIAATPQSLFRIASMTKSFTAMAILQLRDAGKLSLDDRADRYIPELKKFPLLTSDAPPITLRHLLTHAAGFPEDNPWGDRQLDISNAEFLAFLQKPIAFSNTPGVAYEYSNLAFALLGSTIEKVSGQTYQRYITEQILKPLGMTHTMWEYDEVPAAQLAHGYRWRDARWTEVPLLHDGVYGAMGGLITSLEDFTKYVALHQSAWPTRNGADDGPLRRSSLREMQQPWNISGFYPKSTYASGRPCAIVTAYCYGLGWMRDCDGREFVGHTGGLPGFGSNWRFLSEYGVAVVSMANLTYASTSGINTEALDTLIIKAGLQPRQLPVSAILQERQAQLTKLLPDWQNAEASGLFAENFFDDYSIDALREETKALFKKAGKIKSVGPLVPENQLRGAYILEGEKAKLKVSFTLSPENSPLIQAFRLEEVK